MRRDDDAVLRHAHGELEALIGLGEHVVSLARARIDAMHLARAIQIVDDGEVKPSVGPGTGVVGVVDLQGKVVRDGEVVRA